MHITTLLVVLLCLSLHRYLDYYCETNAMPYRFGFAVLVKVEFLLVLANCVYQMRWGWGLGVFVVVFVGSGVLTFPLTFLWHCLTRHDEVEIWVLGERPNPVLYGAWSVLVLVLTGLTLRGFFVTSYGAGLDAFSSWFTSLSTTTVVVSGCLLSVFVYLILGIKIIAQDYSNPVLPYR